MLEEVIESAGTALVMQDLQSMQDQQNGMCQAKGRTIGKKAAHYYKLCRSALSADTDKKCTWDMVYTQLSKTCVAARTKALNDASKAPHRGRQAPHMPAAMAFTAQAEHQLAFGAISQKRYEQMSLRSTACSSMGNEMLRRPSRHTTSKELKRRSPALASRQKANLRRDWDSK